MRYRNIQKGQRYGSRLVLTIHPWSSDLAGPGLERPTRTDDEVAYQDFAEGIRTRCSATKFARWATSWATQQAVQQVGKQGETA